MIYLQHFGLREAPFGITPDTAFYYSCSAIQQGLNTLLVAVANGEGFIKITGEVGTGKTLLCRKLLATLGPEYVTAYLPNPAVRPLTLMRAIAEELALEWQASLDQHHLLRVISQALLEHADAGRRVLLCVDEAQAMPLETLETVRLLTNLETEKRKLLQVVLFGQPELDDKLARREIRQLRQRITFEQRLTALTPAEVRKYLAHRLAVAGYAGREVFSRPAARVIHRASRGVPRLVNILANKALMLAFGRGSRRARWSDALGAAKDTPAARLAQPAWMWVAMVCLAGSSLGWVLLQ